MKFFNFKKNSLSITDDFFNITWVISRLVLIISCITIYFSFINFKKTAFTTLINHQALVLEEFYKALRKTEVGLKKMGHKIIQGEYYDINYIAEVLRTQKFYEESEGNLNTTFAWIDTKNQILATSLHGRQDGVPALDQNCPNYIERSINEPWKAHVYRKPLDSLYIPDTQLIYVTMGVQRAPEGLLGRLAAGLVVSKLKEKLKQKINESTFFIIFDKSQNVIFSSLEGSISAQKPQNITSFEFLEKNYTLEKVPIKGTPFYLIIGSYKSLVDTDFISDVLYKLVTTLAIGFLLLLLLIFYRRRYLKPIEDLSLAANKISAGDLVAPVPKNLSSIELNRLSLGLEKIKEYAAKSHAAKADLEKKNTLLKKSIQELEKLKREKEKALADLENALDALKETMYDQKVFRKEIASRYLQVIKDDEVYLKQIFYAIGQVKKTNLKILPNVLERLESVFSDHFQKIKTHVHYKYEFTSLNELILKTLKKFRVNNTKIVVSLDSNLPSQKIDKFIFKKAFEDLLELVSSLFPDEEIHISTKNIFSRSRGTYNEITLKVSSRYQRGYILINHSDDYKEVETIVKSHDGLLVCKEKYKTVYLRIILNITPNYIDGSHYTLPSEGNVIKAFFNKN